MTNATIIGTGVSALIQGTLMWLAFMVFGLPNGVFWGAVVVMFSLLPVVGSGMVWAPAALVLFSRRSGWRRGGNGESGGPRWAWSWTT